MMIDPKELAEKLRPEEWNGIYEIDHWRRGAGEWIHERELIRVLGPVVTLPDDLISLLVMFDLLVRHPWDRPYIRYVEGSLNNEWITPDKPGFMYQICATLAGFIRMYGKKVDGRHPDTVAPAIGDELLSDDDSLPETDDQTPWHNADEANPAEFPYGPLVGSKSQLRRWILPSHKDTRSLTTWLKAGNGWGREDSRTSCSVWFRDQGRYAEANRQRLVEAQRAT